MLQKIEGVSVNKNVLRTTLYINHTIAAKKLCRRLEIEIIAVSWFQLVYKVRI